MTHEMNKRFIISLKGWKGGLHDTALRVFNFHERWKLEITVHVYCLYTLQAPGHLWSWIKRPRLLPFLLKHCTKEIQHQLKRELMVGYLSGLLSVSHVSMACSKRLLPIPSGAGNSSKQSGSEELGPGGYNIKVMQIILKLVLFQKSQFYIYCKFQMSFINDKIKQF